MSDKKRFWCDIDDEIEPHVPQTVFPVKAGEISARRLATAVKNQVVLAHTLRALCSKRGITIPDALERNAGFSYMDVVVELSKRMRDEDVLKIMEAIQ